MLKYTKEELQNMKTIEENVIFGALKVDTDKERVYLDLETGEISVTWFDEYSGEWVTETVKG